MNYMAYLMLAGVRAGYSPRAAYDIAFACLTCACMHEGV